MYIDAQSVGAFLPVEASTFNENSSALKVR